MTRSRGLSFVDQRLHVRFRYPVYFTRDVFSPRNPVLKRLLRQTAANGHRPSLVIVIDQGVMEAHSRLEREIPRWAERHSDLVEWRPPLLVLPGGETAKNGWRYVRRCIELFLKAGLCRQSLVMALGGGAVLDAVGLATALFHRGLRLIRLPSTTLAQGDAGVGVKNAINLGGIKNAVGTFAPPWAVVNDLLWLDTLSPVDWLAGAAEAIKVAIVRSRSFFRRIEELSDHLACRDADAMAEIVTRTARHHLTHIRRGNDPFEQGTARPLDFGHWAAHQLESLTHHRVGHGMAVAFGIRLDTRYALRKGWLEAPEAAAIERVLDRCGFPSVPAGALPVLARSPDALLDGIDRFREHLGGRLSIPMPRAIGQTFDVHEMDTDVIRACVEDMLQSLK